MARSLPPLNALRAFEAAARHLSFVKAADELAVTPAAISQQVKALEERLGVSLFRRVTRGLKLTQAGRSLLPGLTAGFDALEAAVGTVAGGPDDDSLTLSILPSFAASWLVPRLPRFADAHPDVRLTLQATHALADFQTDGIDLAIRYAGRPPPDLEHDRLMSEDVFPVCSPMLLERHPLRVPDDLRGVPLIRDVMPDGSPGDQWDDWLRTAGMADTDWALARAGAHSDSGISVQAAVAGLGVLMGRELLVADALKRGLLVAPFEARLPSPYSYWLLWPRRTARRKAFIAFRRWLQGEVQSCCDSGLSQSQSQPQAVADAPPVTTPG